MTILLYQKIIDDKKHGVKFPKDTIVYREKTFDAIITKEIRPMITEAINNGLKYPLELTLTDDQYFTKLVRYTKKDGDKGVKTRVVIQGITDIKQGHFTGRTLDEVCDSIDEEWAERVGALGVDLDENN